SAKPLVPNTWMRQNGTVARIVAIWPVAPLANSTIAATTSRGSGGAFGANALASTRRIGPAMLTSASITCRPAPVRPKPGDSRGSSRQPPATRVEWSLEKCPSTCMISPSEPPATSAFSSRMDAKQRLLLPEPSGTPAFRQASTERAASARVSASGFSHQIGLPARATAPTCSGCSECGVARKMACTSELSIASARSVVSLNPCCCAKPRTSSGSLLTPWTKRSRSLWPCTAVTSDLPQRPRPMTAALIMPLFPLGPRDLMLSMSGNPGDMGATGRQSRKHGVGAMSFEPPVGVIGIGLMGEVFARRLVAAGFGVAGFDVDPDKTARLAEFGAHPAASIGDVARAANPIVLAVFDTGQVEQVVEELAPVLAATGGEGEGGALAGALGAGRGAARL